MVEFGEWAIRAACLQHREWLDAGLPPIRIAVNLSARQLREISFVSVFKKALKEIGVVSESLEIEITESLLMADARNTVPAIEELHDLGIRVTMDDFGTGHSSLATLCKLPLNVLKLDRSFVHRLPEAVTDAAVAEAVVTLARRLGLSVVAEGGETEAQRNFLADAGCDVLQGFLFARPLPAAALEAWLAARGSSQ